MEFIFGGINDMPMEPHNKIIRDAAKEILSPHGIFQKGQSRIWIDDNSWFLTVIEFQPSGWSKGSYLNVGINFLWTNKDYISFDYSNDFSARVCYENGGQVYFNYENNEQFNEKSKFLALLALEKALYFRRFNDLTYAKQRLLSKRFGDEIWKAWHRMIICFLTNDNRAWNYLSIFSQFNPNNEFLQQFIKEQTEIINSFACDIGAIQGHVKSNISKQRDFWRTKGLKKLSNEFI